MAEFYVLRRNKKSTSIRRISSKLRDWFSFHDTCNWIYAYITWDEEANARTLQILRCDFKDFTYGGRSDNTFTAGKRIPEVTVDHAQAQFFYKIRRHEMVSVGSSAAC